MPKVHPDAAGPEQPPPPVDEPPTVQLTVWRKSLLFNCHGFTVFDAKGDLAFRVDCYASGRRRTEVVLMDVAGKPLLTLRRKRLSLAEHWVIYDGDADADAAAGKSKPLLSIRRHVSLRRASSKKALAHVTSLAATTSSYVVEGSYGRRACAVREERGDAVVAEVRRKESVGDDVFRLVADPRLGAPLAMGLVIALDEMFGGSRGSARSSLLRRREDMVGVAATTTRAGSPTCRNGAGHYSPHLVSLPQPSFCKAEQPQPLSLAIFLSCTDTPSP